MKLTFIVMILLGLSNFSSLLSQWTYYDIANNEIPIRTDLWDIAIDSKDNVWIASNAGLIKFDGENWTVYDTTNSPIKEHSFRCVTIDTEDNIWAGTHESKSDKAALVKFDGKNNWEIFNYDNSPIYNASIWDVEITNNSIWVGTRFDLHRYYIENKTWHTYKEGTIPDESVKAIQKMPNNEGIWIGTDGGVAKYENSQWTTYDTNLLNLNSNRIYQVTIDSSNNVWISAKAMIRYDGNEWKHFDDDVVPTEWRWLYGAEVDKYGTIWFTGMMSLTTYDGNKWQIYKADSLLKEYEWVVFDSHKFDSKGNCWMVVNNPVDFDGIMKFNTKPNGVQNKFVADGIEVMPNPAKETISFKNIKSGSYDIKIYNNNSILIKNINAKINSSIYTLDINTLPIGVYYIAFESKNDIIIKNFMKKIIKN